MRDLIPFMTLHDEIWEVFALKFSKLIVQFTVFEDNCGALELAVAPKICPRTKHISLKYHHFRSVVDSGRVAIKTRSTSDQIADTHTKALEEDTFEKLRKLI